MLIDNAGIARGEPLRARIDQMTAEFIAAGGQVQQCGASPSRYEPIPFSVAPAAAQQDRRKPPRRPRSPSSQEDLAAFAWRMLEAGI